MPFQIATQLGPKQALTPQGFLVCQDVPIARTGLLLYAAGELGPEVKAGSDGIIRVTRAEDEVFSPATVASFEHNTLTIDHPEDFVLPRNWRGLAVGIPLRLRQWAAFAERYNGPGFRANAYDQKLEKAHARLAALAPMARPIAAMLSIGDRGEAVRQLQRALIGQGYPLTADGVFGRVTEVAVQQFQQRRGLAPDGVVGPVTAGKLGL